MGLMKLIRFSRYILRVLERKDLYFKIEAKVKKEKFGSDYGGYFICPDTLSPKSVVYSIGVGEDLSFDLALMQEFHCKVYGFDPTLKSINWVKHQNLSEEYTFYPFVVSNYDGKAIFYPVFKNPNYVSHTEIMSARAKRQDSCAFENQVHSLSTVMQMLKHDSIDLLKMDIEGGEYKVIPHIAENKLVLNKSA